MKFFSYIFITRQRFSSDLARLFFIGVLCAGCGPQETSAGVIEAKAIDEFLGQETINHESYLKIRKEALGRDFMFYGSFIPMLKSPTGYSLRGRIINFKVFADRVVMLESPQGLSIAKQDESVILLAEFPIVAREQDYLVIDFAKGMKSAFTTRNVHSNALPSSDEDASNQFSSVSLSISFIKSIVAQDDVLTISQIAQWRNKDAESVSAEFRYFLREYNPSPTFKKKAYEKNRHVLYFSTPPQIEPPTTKPFAYVAKWDIEKPIIFHLSRNTPSEYVQAITDGILYWNHIFGQEILQVQELESDISAPHHRLNIVQWVSWDNEASAYADMVVDHLTGETLQAQVYLRSGWVFESSKKIRQNLQELMLTNKSPSKLASTQDGTPMPDMFHFEEACTKTLSTYESIANLAEMISSQDVAKPVFDSLTGDIIRAVVAHEFGHVLGLRHNFAASTDGNISLKDHDDLLRAYLSDAKPPLGHKKYLSKSVMDVFSASDDALLGSQIRQLINAPGLSKSKLAQIYSFDRNAIAYGYFDQPMPGDTPFCSDADLTTFIDCRRWDYSNTPLLYTASLINSIMTRVAFVLADTFMEAIKPDRKGGPAKIRDVSLLSGGVLQNVQTNLKELFSWFHQNARSAQVEANFAAYGPQNRVKINAERFKKVRAQIEQNGLTQTLFATLPPYNTTGSEIKALVKKFSNQFSALIENEKQHHPSFSISPEDLAQAEDIATNFFSTLNQDVIRLAALVISTTQFDDADYQMPIENSLGIIAKELILAHKKTQDKKITKLPKFTYSLKTRDAATGLLRPGLGLLSDWSFESMQQTIKQLKLLMRTYSKPEANGSINLSTLDRVKRAWILEQSQILSALNKASTATRILNPPTPAPPATSAATATTPNFETPRF